jgi:hypothetical protein
MATWGTLTWSTGNFGDQTNSTFPPNGIGASFNLGTVVTTATVDFGWSNNAWGLVDWNTNELNADGIVTGFGMTSTLGDETTVNEVNVGWGRLLWGENAWGIAGDVAVTGFSLSSNLGSVTTQANADVIPTSLPMTASQGDESIEISFEIELTGISITSNLGIADAGPDAMLEGIGATGSVGSVEAYNLEGWGRYFYGQFVWGATGEWANVDVTGIEMSAATNPEGIPSFTAEADAQLSTAQAKFGPSSLLLDGTGDFVQSTATDVVQNNFTIEFFAYASNFAQDAYLWDNQSSNQGFAFSITSAGQLRLIQDGTILQQTGTPSLNNNQWNHFALVQNSTLLTLYINGTPKLQYSTGGDSYPGQSYKIGANEAETQFFNGYIDEFRSSDIAVYTGLFTPPTSPFTVDGNTISLLHFDGANGSTQIFNETQNAYSITGTANTDVTGEAMTAAEGIVDPAPDAEVTGIGFDASLAVGTVVIGEANVTVVGEGFAAGLGVGTLDAVTLVDLTGISMSANIGTITAKGFANVSLTGFGLTMAEGTNRTLIWNQVNTGTAPTWTEVDTAA